MQKQTMLQTLPKKKSKKALTTWSNRNKSCWMEREGKKKGEKDALSMGS